MKTVALFVKYKQRKCNINDMVIDYSIAVAEICKMSVLRHAHTV